MSSPSAERRAASTRVAAAVRALLPRGSDYTELPRSWRQDLLAGVTVGVVALPLALGFGVASGVGAAAGLVTAIVAGLLAAVLGGSHLQVSGPTGAMAVVLVPVVALPFTESVALLAILAGALVVLMGLTRLGRLVSVIPWPVVEGFTLGIGVIILLQQIPLALDTPRAAGENTVLVGISTLAAADWSQAMAPLAVTAGVGLVMAVLGRLHRGLPSSLIAVAVATIAVELAHLDIARIGSLPSTLPTPSLPALDGALLSDLLPAAVAIAALAALESLLSARVADGMVEGVPATDSDRELVGQGLASVASGLVGGMPATGAIARTAVNVRAGARTRVAAASHALVLALVVLAAAPLVARIPMAALAGVLMVTALRMIDLGTARSIARASWSDGSVYLITVAVTIAFDLVVAVQVGIAVAAVIALRALARSSGPRLIAPGEELDAHPLDEHMAVYRLRGALYFGATKRFLDEITAARDVQVVILALAELGMMDASGGNAIREIVLDLRRRGVTVLVKSRDETQLRVLRALGVLEALGGPDHVFTDLAAAVAHGRNHVRYSRADIWSMNCAEPPR